MCGRCAEYEPRESALLGDFAQFLTVPIARIADRCVRCNGRGRTVQTDSSSSGRGPARVAYRGLAVHFKQIEEAFEHGRF
jgi:hypothetical protein